MEAIQCPFVYSRGKRCSGHIIRVEAFKADLEWNFNADGSWSFACGAPRSHYHLFCSEKDNHAGIREDTLKYYADTLPAGLWDKLKMTFSG
ncbi:MAG TPA: hypothetical protein VNF29_07295 [Candidatus Binataceae bacterium]|nr:hypothetical protein [Candidatus Binataceae bacterium]